MLSTIKTISLNGLEGYLVEVQVDGNTGLPSWEVVGLPNTSVKEAKERVKVAIKNSGFELKSQKIVVNLSPANIRKDGTFFDLPIAIGILKNLGNIRDFNIKNTVFIGELSLNRPDKQSKWNITNVFRSKEIRHRDSNITKRKCQRRRYNK